MSAQQVYVAVGAWYVATAVPCLCLWSTYKTIKQVESNDLSSRPAYLTKLLQMLANPIH